MKKKVVSAMLCAAMTIGMLSGCGGGQDAPSDAAADSGTEADGADGADEGQADEDQGDADDGGQAEGSQDFAGEELSILVSSGWMDNRYDETIARFEET